MTPYYSDEFVTIYHGDCREILPALPCADVVCADPPYGTARLSRGGSGGGWGNVRASDAERTDWDVAPDDDLLALVLAAGTDQIIWGGNHFDLPPSRCWLVWDKKQRGMSLADAELAWTNLDKVTRVYSRIRMSPTRGDVIEHPTQKPVELMRWCLGFVREGTVVDPFIGSGSTLRAAKDLGRKAIGIEKVERYCEIAARRMGQEVLAL